MRTLLLLATIWITWLISSGVSLAQEPRPEVDVSYVKGNGPEARIVNGQPTTWYPAVGELLHSDGKTFGSYCTATLIGCGIALTAAHCVAKDREGGNYRLFFQHGGLTKIKSIALQEDKYQEPDQNGEQADVAVLELGGSITGIVPYPINQEFEQPPNVPGVIVGFGRTGGAATDYGLKRLGLVNSAYCGDGFAENEMICWDYDGIRSNTCSGDSGGPLLSSENRDYEVITGVTSGGRNGSCLSSDHSFDTSVFRYSNWIKTAAGTDLGTRACGTLVPLAAKLKDNDKRFVTESGQLSSTSPRHIFEVRVKRAGLLRVGVNVAKFLNADAYEGAAIPRISIVKSRADNTANALCTSETPGAAAFCELPSPEDDEIYTILLDRFQNQGRADFQLVISVF
jgi:hypothetical protein